MPRPELEIEFENATEEELRVAMEAAPEGSLYVRFSNEAGPRELVVEFSNQAGERTCPLRSRPTANSWTNRRMLALAWYTTNYTAHGVSRHLEWRGAAFEKATAID